MVQVKSISSIIFLLTGLLLLSNCSSRFETPVLSEDETITYPSRKADGVSAQLSFCRRIDKKNKLTGEGQAFTIMNDGWVRAVARLHNLTFNGNREQMFHFDWIGPDGKSLYLKRFDLVHNDSTNIISSSISISPETRLPGEYTLKLYYFRELIAEKKFDLLPKFNVAAYTTEEIAKDIILCNKIDKKTSRPSGVDSIFTIREKKNVIARFDFENHFSYKDREMLFSFQWFEGDTTPFYRKRIDVAPGNTSTVIVSSISLDPEKRSEGEYYLKLFLFNELMAEKKFILQAAPDVSEIAKNIKANVRLYKKQSKKSGKLIGEGSEFKLGNKNKVRATITLSNQSPDVFLDQEFMLKWFGPDNKSFYQKKIDFDPNSSISKIKSAISISPEKRAPGEYFLRVYYYDEVIAEKIFVVRPE